MDARLAQLAAAGFDVAHTFDAAAAAREPGLELLAGDDRLGILIGNTRALWPPFSAALHELGSSEDQDGNARAKPEPALAADPDPLERYTERSIAQAFSDARVYYGHRRYAGAFLPLQRLAVATGLGALAPSQLVIHPVHGPWLALRAVVVVAGAPPERRPIALPCTCGAPCARALEQALASPRSWQRWLAVRDACTLRGSRYGDDQIRYHYTRAWPGG